MKGRVSLVQPHSQIGAQGWTEFSLLAMTVTFLGNFCSWPWKQYVENLEAQWKAELLSLNYFES